jgi:glycosyltransferase involved in cell wall biosynthesis
MPQPRCDQAFGACVRPGVLFAGNFLSSHGRKRSVSEDVSDRLESRGWPVIRTSSKLSRPLRLIDMVACVCSNSRRFAVAHVDVYSGPAFFWAEAVSATLRYLNRPYIFTLHGGALPEFAERWPARVHRLISSAALVTAPSEYLARRMERYCRALIIPNAVDVRNYPVQEFLRSSKPKLVWLRSFHDIYNPCMAVEAFALLRDEFPDLELIMIGPDDGDGSLKRTRQRALELRVADTIHFPGRIPKSDVPTWLAQASVFLNTANVDNSPVSVLEAMACGLPIVSTNVGGIPDLVENGTNGLLVPPQDAQAMAASTRDVLRHHELARQLSLSARQTAKKCDWHTVIPLWEELLESVCG